MSDRKREIEMEQPVGLRSATGYEVGAAGSSSNNEANSPGVSWAAVIGGASVTAALSLILLSLGAGLGLSAVSVWSQTGVSIGTGAILWLILTQIMSSSMGGYLAGRLRTKWTAIHTDEVYFRDTAHGFLAWAAALVITAAFLTSAAASMVGAPPSHDANVAAAEVAAAGLGVDADAYLVDSLLRSENARLTSDRDSASLRGEVSRIFANALRQRSLPPEDKSYLAQIVVARTGLSPADAGMRVSNVFGTVQQTAEAARKALAHSLLWIFIALLFGAFCASFAATIGGGQRDHVVVV
jgi:hypothetical protein